MRLLEIPEKTLQDEIHNLERLPKTPAVTAAIYTLLWLKERLSMSPSEMYRHEKRSVAVKPPLHQGRLE